MDDIRGIENQYRDDGVKILIRQKEILASPSLVNIIRRRLMSLLHYSSVFRFETSIDRIPLSDADQQKLNAIASAQHCKLQRVEYQDDVQIFSIPKATSNPTKSWDSLLQRSEALDTCLTVKKLPIMNGSIEVYFGREKTTVKVSGIRKMSSKCENQFMESIKCSIPSNYYIGRF